MPRKPIGEAPMTAAERQARRREQFRRMKEALERVAEAATVKEARALADGALSGVETTPAYDPNLSALAGEPWFMEAREAADRAARILKAGGFTGTLNVGSGSLKVDA